MWVYLMCSGPFNSQRGRGCHVPECKQSTSFFLIVPKIGKLQICKARKIFESCLMLLSYWCELLKEVSKGRGIQWLVKETEAKLISLTVSKYYTQWTGLWIFSKSWKESPYNFCNKNSHFNCFHKLPLTITKTDNTKRVEPHLSSQGLA